MSTLRSAVMFSLLMAVAANTFAADFPTAPANQKEAEAKGLQRANLGELKKFIPGIMDLEGFKGILHKMTYKPDGSYVGTGFDPKNSTGKWHFDDKNNTYCHTKYVRNRNEDYCFAVFRAPDGINFFDYDIKDGFYAHVWHPAIGE